MLGVFQVSEHGGTAVRTRRGMIISEVTTEAPHAEQQMPATTFRELGVLPETAEALDALGIVTPFPIQALTIPVALSGNDVIGQAKTGTGKTLAFGVPLLQHVTVDTGAEVSASDTTTTDEVAEAQAGESQAVAPAKTARRRSRRRGGRTVAPVDNRPAGGRPQALVVVPTRELAVQVTNDLSAVGKVRAVRVLAVYGGRAYEPQIDALRAGVDVVVGTPGRLLDLNRQAHLDLSGVRVLVLDEADEMLDLGFLPDVERIVAKLPTRRQTMLFSATMPGQVIALARQYLSRPTHIRAADPDDQGATVSAVAQHVFRAHVLDKVEMLARILQAEGRGLTMVFCRTKRTCAKVAEDLTERGFAAAAVHGDLGQGAREQALRAFRNGKVDVLVATDVAARGIDVDDVTHVVNFQCPEDEKVYLHRIGRTARAGKSGTAVTFVDWEDMPRWSLVNNALDLPFTDPPETYSTSEHLYEELGIPQDAKGVLPKQQRTREGLDAEAIEDLGETGAKARRGRGRQGQSAESRNRRGRGRTAASADEPSATTTLAEATETASAPRAPRRARQRRRTRGGMPIETSPAES
jgi:superfamily II DNA/RNA helicase